MNIITVTEIGYPETLFFNNAKCDWDNLDYPYFDFSKNPKTVCLPAENVRKFIRRQVACVNFTYPKREGSWLKRFFLGDTMLDVQRGDDVVVTELYIKNEKYPIYVRESVKDIEKMLKGE